MKTGLCPLPDTGWHSGGRIFSKGRIMAFTAYDCLSPNLNVVFFTYLITFNLRIMYEYK